MSILKLVAKAALLAVAISVVVSVVFPERTKAFMEYPEPSALANDAFNEAMDELVQRTEMLADALDSCTNLTLKLDKEKKDG